MDKIIDVINNIKNKESVKFEDVFLKKELSDLEIISLIAYCIKENINFVEKSFDMDILNLDNYISHSDVIEYFENIENEDYGDEILNKYRVIAIEEAIKNTKINFSFIDIRNEAIYSMYRFRNEFYEKLLKKYSNFELEYILRNFIKTNVLKYQKFEIDKMKEQELIYLLYIKIESELEKGKKLNCILETLGITKEYYLNLKKVFLNLDSKLSYDEIIEETERINRKYEIAFKTHKLNHILEQILISKVNNIEVNEKLFKEGILKLSLIINYNELNNIEKTEDELE